jgi:sulfate adenylyltransferase
VTAGRGVCLWFTGLSGSGKSTTADRVTAEIRARGREVTVLDGDVVRTHLSQGLGFDRADRDINVRRIGFVAAEVVRHGGIAVCAVVSPYRSTRDEVRAMVGRGFVEVFVDTPLEVCEARDVKGLYARARAGEVTAFTGISDPYEPPVDPELTLDTVGQTLDENVRRVIALLEERGVLELASVPAGDRAQA